MYAAMAKAYCSDAFFACAGEAIQLHGGVGFTWEYDCHLFLKRARLNEALGWNNRAQQDFAAAGLAQAARDGRSTAELVR